MAISQIQLEQPGHLASINQSGWNVSYEQYTRVGTLELPSRMTIVREQLKLRLSINKWTMTDES
jgi:outer membrane biogenesis lipoprotein LolB